MERVSNSVTFGFELGRLGLDLVRDRCHRLVQGYLCLGFGGDGGMGWLISNKDRRCKCGWVGNLNQVNTYFSRGIKRGHGLVNTKAMLPFPLIT